MKTKIKRVLLSWLKVMGQMFLGWLIYTPVYLFYATGFFVSMALTHLLEITFWQALGLVILIRYLRNVWRLAGDLGSMEKFKVHREPYQVPEDELETGLCMYGDQLLVNTESGLFDVKTGKAFLETGKRFSPTNLSS